jgi:rhodanese-related sulfurtransferase
MRQMNAKDLKNYLETVPELPVLLDVREPWEFQTCHIEGSLHVPMGQIPQAYKQLDPSKEIVVICHHGMRSLQVGQFLEKAGFKNIINLSGGVDAWAREVDANMPVY